MTIKDDISKEVGDYINFIKKELSDDEIRQVDDFISESMENLDNIFSLVDNLSENKDLLEEMRILIKDYLEVK